MRWWPISGLVYSLPVVRRREHTGCYAGPDCDGSYDSAHERELLAQSHGGSKFQRSDSQPPRVSARVVSAPNFGTDVPAEVLALSETVDDMGD